MQISKYIFSPWTWNTCGSSHGKKSIFGWGLERYFCTSAQKKKGSEISVTLVKYRQTRPLLIVIIQFVLKKINSSPSVQAEHAVLVLYWFPCHFTSRWEDSALPSTPILHVLPPGHPSFYFPDPSSPFNPRRLSRAFVLTPPVDGASNVSQTGGPSADRL